MTIDISETVVIECPIEAVAMFSGDPSNAPAWCRRVIAAEWHTEPPVALGSRVSFNARFLGRDLKYVYEVSEFTVSEQIALRAVEGPLALATTYTWRALSERATHMTFRSHGTPSGLARLVAPFMVGTMRRTMRHDLEALKQLLES
jgi:uncharacterized membrane protein